MTRRNDASGHVAAKFMQRPGRAGVAPQAELDPLPAVCRHVRPSYARGRTAQPEPPCAQAAKPVDSRSARIQPPSVLVKLPLAAEGVSRGCLTSAMAVALRGRDATAWQLKHPPLGRRRSGTQGRILVTDGQVGRPDSRRLCLPVAGHIPPLATDRLTPGGLRKRCDGSGSRRRVASERALALWNGPRAHR